jgi:predicted acyltransferase
MKPERFRSLDVFRGATVALMILVNNPGSWSFLYGPLAHAPWHGVTPTDLVFPFFLFAVGNALALVLPALLAGPRAAFWLKVARRTALIFLIGLLLNAAPFVRWDAAGELAMRDWSTLRTMGVLQRIALCFGAAAVIVALFGARGALWATATLLVGYWLLSWALGAPGDPFSLGGFWGTALDRALLGESHLYRGEGMPFDPEGLASTAPAVAQVLLGWWVGSWIVAARAPGGEGIGAPLLLRLFLWAMALLVLAYVWQLHFPLNKKIWSSSYVLHTTGLAMMTLALCMHVIDIRRRPAELWGWARFFEVFGKNALFVFVLSGLVPRVLALARWPLGTTPEGAPQWTSPLPWLYNTVFAPIGSAVGDARFGSLLFACANLSLYWALAAWLDRRRIFIRV